MAEEPRVAPSLSPLAAAPDVFQVDGPLKKNIEFWISIYTQYYTHQGLIHDAKYVDRIYEVLDLRDPSGRSQKRVVREAKRRWRNLLLSVHRKRSSPSSLTPEEFRVYDMYRDVQDPNKFLNAAHRRRLRFQLGQRDRFQEGLKASGRYLPEMEEIFRREGLPIELTRLPFVESSFNLKARSKVGASGIWQFMRSTGRLFLRIDDAVDERNDPIRAAEAAARLLRQNYESLGSWPLAVTAYNHGRMGMMRAVRKVGSEQIEDVISSYRSRTFGFASSNFFAELVAAVEVERNAEKYFGVLERDPVPPSFEVELPDSIGIRELCRFLKLDLGRIREINPALSEQVILGRRLLPAGYRLRVPYDPATGDRDSASRVFLAGYSEIPSTYKRKGRWNRFSGRRVTADRVRSP